MPTTLQPRKAKMIANDYRLIIIWVSPAQARLFHRPVNGTGPGDLTADWIESLEGLSGPAQFFEAIRKKIFPFQNLVILGPDMKKFHFRTFLQEQSPDLFRKVIGFETVSDISSALGNAFLEKYQKLLTP